MPFIPFLETIVGVRKRKYAYFTTKALLYCPCAATQCRAGGEYVVDQQNVFVFK